MVGDAVAADACFQEQLNDDGYLTSKECEAAEEAVAAYKAFDAERLAECVAQQPACKGSSIRGGHLFGRREKNPRVQSR